MQFSLSRKKAAPTQQEAVLSVDQQGSSESTRLNLDNPMGQRQGQPAGYRQNTSNIQESSSTRNIHEENLKRIRDMDGQEVKNFLHNLSQQPSESKRNCWANALNVSSGKSDLQKEGWQLSAMQIAAAKREIEANLSDKAIQFLRNRRKAGSTVRPAENASSEARESLPAQNIQKSMSKEEGKQKEFIPGLVQAAKGKNSRHKILLQAEAQNLSATWRWVIHRSSILVKDQGDAALLKCLFALVSNVILQQSTLPFAFTVMIGNARPDIDDKQDFSCLRFIWGRTRKWKCGESQIQSRWKLCGYAVKRWEWCSLPWERCPQASSKSSDHFWQVKSCQSWCIWYWESLLSDSKYPQCVTLSTQLSHISSTMQGRAYVRCWRQLESEWWPWCRYTGEEGYTIREACILARSSQPALRAAACRLIAAVATVAHPTWKSINSGPAFVQLEDVSKLLYTSQGFDLEIIVYSNQVWALLK